jgi:hypothetical protein
MRPRLLGPLEVCGPAARKWEQSADWLGYILGVGAAKGTVHHGTLGGGILGPMIDARADRHLRHLTAR